MLSFIKLIAVTICCSDVEHRFSLQLFFIGKKIKIIIIFAFFFTGKNECYAMETSHVVQNETTKEISKKKGGSVT